MTAITGNFGATVTGNGDNRGCSSIFYSVKLVRRLNYV